MDLRENVRSGSPIKHKTQAQMRSTHNQAPVLRSQPDKQRQREREPTQEADPSSYHSSNRLSKHQPDHLRNTRCPSRNPLLDIPYNRQIYTISSTSTTEQLASIVSSHFTPRQHSHLRPTQLRKGKGKNNEKIIKKVHVAVDDRVTRSNDGRQSTDEMVTTHER